MMNKEDSQIQAVLRHHTGKALHSIPKEAEAYLTEAGTKDLITNDLPKPATLKAKKLKLKYKEDVNKLVRDRWKEKAMHGKLPKYLEKDRAQDQALNTRYYSKHIIKQGSTDRCRMCHMQMETVEHIISGCQTLAAEKYLNKHNQVAAQLHLDICRATTWPPRPSSTAECLCLIACLREEQASAASWEPRPPFEVAEMD